MATQLCDKMSNVAGMTPRQRGKCNGTGGCESQVGIDGMECMRSDALSWGGGSCERLNG